MAEEENLKERLDKIEERLDTLEKTKSQDIIFPCDDRWWSDEEPSDIEVQESGDEEVEEE